MGFFGRDPRAATDIEPSEEALEEQHEDLPELPEPLSTTIIAEGITLTGNLEGDGMIQVEGTVEGEIKLRGQVIVTPTGVIKGPVDATAIQVAGNMEGNISASDRLLLKRTGVIDGDVVTASFIIEDGGCLNGRTSMMKRERGITSYPATTDDALQFGPSYTPEVE